MNINFLQMPEVIFVPIFNLKNDDIALRVLVEAFKDQKIVPLESGELAREGGLLNCISWNIFP